LKTQITGLQEQITAGEGDTATLEAEITRLNTELTAANDAVSTLEAEIAAMDEAVGTTGDAVEPVPEYTLNGVVDTSSSVPEGTDGTEEGGTTEPTEPAFDINTYLSSTNQTILTNMTITNVSNITKSGSTIDIYADDTFDKGTAFMQNDNFSTKVIPELNAALEITNTYDQEVRVYSHSGVLINTYSTKFKNWN
jgi:hypothetical protein